MNRSVVCLVLIGVLVCVGWAQPDAELTLDQCIDIALKTNSQLRNAERQVEVSGTQLTDAWSSFLPTVNTSFSSGKFIQGARSTRMDVPVDVDPVTGRVIYEEREIDQESTNRYSHSASITLNQKIWDFGRSSNTVRQVKASKSAARHNARDVRRAVILNVKQAYYHLLKVNKLRTVYEQAVQLAEKQVDEAQARLDIGLASQAEVYEAKVNLGTNRAQLITQENAVEMAKADLNFALGRDADTSVQAIEDKSRPTFPSFSLSNALEVALEQNEYIKRLDLEAKSYRFAIQTAKSRFMPSVGMRLTYQRNNDDISRVYSTELDRDFSATIGVGMDLNVFNGFADKAAVQRQILNYEMAVENLKEAKRVLTADVKQYFIELEAYRDLLEINRENIEAARENLRLQLEKRRVGSGTELEVTQAQVKLTEAQSEFVRAEYDAKIALARLEKVMGKNEY